jgi:hypothetical protein
MTVLWLLLKPHLARVAILAAALAAVVLVLLRARAAGRAAALVEQAERALVAARARRDNEIALRRLGGRDLHRWLRPPAERR